MHTLNRLTLSLLFLALMFMPLIARGDTCIPPADDPCKCVYDADKYYGLQSLACKAGLYIPPSQGTLDKPATQTLQQMLINITRLALSFISILAVAMIIYGGLMWMTAAGNEEKAKKAQKVILMASIGLIVCTTAWFLLAFIVQTTQSVLSP